MRLMLRESICEYEVNEDSIDISMESMLFICDNLFKKHGWYVFIGNDDVILYIGKSKDLSARIPTSYRERKNYAKINKIMYQIIQIQYLEIPQMILPHHLNYLVMIRHFKHMILFH